MHLHLPDCNYFIFLYQIHDISKPNEERKEGRKEGGMEGGRGDGAREGGKRRGRERGRTGRRDGGTEGRREGGRDKDSNLILIIMRLFGFILTAPLKFMITTVTKEETKLVYNNILFVV